MTHRHWSRQQNRAQTKAIILQNFVGTIVVDASGILLAAFGLLNPLAAAFIRVASELTFTLNSTRMLVPPERLAREEGKSRLEAARPDLPGGSCSCSCARLGRGLLTPVCGMLVEGVNSPGER
jgi:hypothetical protein